MAIKDGPTTDYFRETDIAAFKRAAKLFKVYIAVRRINPKSIPYMEKAGYAPKLIDCKAKTAENNVRINGRDYKTAGLVIDCDVYKDHLLDAFGADKIAGAVKEWSKFTAGGKLAPKSIYGEDGKSLRTIEPAFSYFTQMDPSHEHYGCIRHSPTTQARGGKYVHGDYDLYAVVPADNPSANKFVIDEGGRLGERHARSQHQMDVQNYITAHIGPGMVSHGEQDTFKQDLNDELDLFHPDGMTVEPILGPAAIRKLYAERFGGRLMGGAETAPAGGGKWVTPVRI
jgi:hypothetical protein